MAKLRVSETGWLPCNAERMQSTLSLSPPRRITNSFARRSKECCAAFSFARLPACDQWRPIIQDVGFALRMFRKYPAFTAVTLITLAVGIGLNTAVFTVTNAALFKGFPLVKDNDRILYITNRTIPYPDFEDWRTQSKS